MIMLLYPVSAAAVTGVVSKVDVCGIGHAIFKTSSGLYVTARYLSGEVLETGEQVSGKLKTYGVQSIVTPSGRKGNYYIIEFKSNRLDAVRAFCGSRWNK